MNLKIKYVVEDVDRHGNVRIYFRRRGFRKVRINEPVGSDDFWTIYNRLVDDSDAGKAPQEDIDNWKPAPGTWRALCVDYLSSQTFLQLDPSTQTARRRIIEGTWDEPLEPDSEFVFGQMPVERFGQKAVKVLRDRKSSLPAAANGRIKAVSTVFRWAIEDERPNVFANPARDVPRLKTSSTGFHTWTRGEVLQYENKYPIGTKPRLALALLLLTGVRRSDLVRLGPWCRHGDQLLFTAWKNRNTSNAVEMDIPVLPELQRILDAGPLGDATYIETSFGKPFTSNGFGGWFRDRCNEAGLPHCSAHGLRKAGSTRAAENGATPHQLMAMFGWTTIQQAEIYTKAAQRSRLAGTGMPLIVSHSE